MNAKRILAMILALALCFGLMTPAVAFAAEDEPAETVEQNGEQNTEPSAPAEEVTEEIASTEPIVAAEKEPEVTNYADFLACLKVLEGYAEDFASTNTAYKVPQLIINYIRTGVDRYLDGNWKTLAGEEITVFVDYVAEQDISNGTHARCLRNIITKNFKLPNGQQADFGHMFGALNIAYVSGVMSGDLGSWAGDLCDLMQYSRDYGNVPEGTIDEKAAYILENCFGIDAEKAFGMDDFYGDLDAFYINTKVKAGESITDVFEGYYLDTLTDADRAEYFLNNRFSGLLTREDVREAVYRAYANNPGLSILEADRELSGESDLRYACCYAFADYLFSLAGDRLTGETEDPVDPDQPEDPSEPENPSDPENPGEGEEEKPAGNPYYTVFSSTTSMLAPGLTQTIQYAVTADNKQLAYYIAKVDINRDDLSIHANYKDNDPTKGWGMARVTDQMAAAAENHKHIENYSTVLGVNGDFYNMSTGKPSGALVMEGVTYQGANGANFFAILDDGTPVIGTGAEWDTYKDRVVEAIGGSIMLVRDGKSVVGHYGSYYNNRASRTCVGITADGQVILMVLDGRQEPYSCGGSDLEIAQIMVDAGCVIAMNLDGGGSTTFAAKAEGSDEVTVVNSPSDGYARSVSSSLLVVSTGKISNEFHHAVISTERDYLTIGTAMELVAVGVSDSGNAAEVPEGAAWKVSDETIGSVSNGIFTAKDNGDVTVQLVLADGTVVGEKTLHVVIPDEIHFTETSLNAIYGVALELPLEASYKGNPVAVNADDFAFLSENDAAGTFEGMSFIGNEASGIRVTNVYAILLADDDLFAQVRICLYSSDEAMFDFSNITAGDRQLAWLREVSNATTYDNVLYQVVEPDKEMGIKYTFGLDMTAIEIPSILADLVGMLPGGDNPDATAWDFLLQLAERISVLTEVRATVQFDPNLEINCENLKVVNEYFVMKEYTFDEETNSLSIICKWVDQTAAIPSETANPICIISGITAKPKDGAAWNAENALAITNTGEVSYTIYLRANALYAFAQIEENQKKYKLTPFENPDVIIGGTTEKGAYFGDVYATFTDAFTLNKTNRQGWYAYENFLYYFVDNEPVTGIQLLPKYEDPSKMCFYEFAEDGTCSGTLSGLLEYNGKLYFPMLGDLRTGWQTVKTGNVINNYYFHPSTGAAVDGKQTIGGYTYEFENCILVKGQIVTNSTGSRYMWAGEFITQAWVEVDGKLYYAHQNAYFMTGLKYQYGPDGAWTWFAFADDGHVMTEIDGIYDYEDERYLVEKGIVNPYPGLVFIDGYYYYFNSAGIAIRDRDYWTTKNNDLLPQALYHFDWKGRMTNPPDGSYVEPADPMPPQLTAEWVSITTTLSGDIGLNFYARLSQPVLEDETAFIRFTFAGRTLDVPVSQAVVSVKNGENQYRFTCPITSKNMTDSVTAQFMNKDGNIGTSKTMDVATYCNWVIANSKDQKTVNLMKGMLNYGAAAQKLFKYRTDDLANAQLSDADKFLPEVDATPYAHVNAGSEEGIKVTSMTLLLDSETTARVYFQLTGDKTIEEFTFVVNGKEVEPTYKDGKYYVEIRNIGAHKLDKMHTVTCGGITVEYAALSYVNQVMNFAAATPETVEMAKALYAYYLAAADYIS